MEKQIYPVGYTVMPIFKTRDLNTVDTKEEEKKDLIAYIPTKCYVVSSSEKISKSGKINRSYGVVYRYITGRSIAENYYMTNYPKYDSNGECINSAETEFLTDNFEYAFEQAIVSNKQLLNSGSYSKALGTDHLKSSEKHEELIKSYLKTAVDYLEPMASDISVSVKISSTDKKIMLK